MGDLHRQVVVVRHGETAWARDGRHTGWTDVPLDHRGVLEAESLRGLLDGRVFARVLVSPLQRAVQTCHLAGFGEGAELRPDLREWNYGQYEGRTTADIQQEHPGWSLWHADVPGGESVTEVGIRADRIIAEVRSIPGDVALFAHGHLLRILTARWLGMAATAGACFALDPAGMGTLGYEHTSPVIVRWNLTGPIPDHNDKEAQR